MMTFSLLPNLYAMSPAQGSEEGSGMIQMVMFGLVFLIFFMLVIRPQSKKAKKHKELVADLKKGDRVITSSGIFAIVSKVFDEKDYLLAEIADKVIIKIKKDNISTVADPNKKPEKEKKSKAEDEGNSEPEKEKKSKPEKENKKKSKAEDEDNSEDDK